MSRQQLFAAFFFAVFLFLLFQVYALFSLFLVPLIWAVILVLAFYPLFTLLLSLFQGRRTLISLLMTVFVVLLVAVPVFLFSSVLASEALGLYQRISEATQSGELQHFLSGWRETFLGRLWQKWGPQVAAFDIDLPGLALQGANVASQFIAGQATGIAKNLFVFLFDFLIMSFSLFFLFRDGEGLYFTLCFFLACISALASFQPIGGAAVVWLPCVFYLGLSGTWGKALILLGYGILIVSGVDNVLKPLIIGGRTKLPTLFLFFGILGGLEAYGFLGIFLGPVVLATIMAFVNIYKEEYTQQIVEDP